MNLKKKEKIEDKRKMSFKELSYYTSLSKNYVDSDLKEEVLRKKFNIDEDEEDIDILYEKMKEIMSKNHPLLFKDTDIQTYKKNMKEMVEIKSLFLSLGKKMVFDMYFGRKIRQLHKLKKEINEENLNIKKTEDVYQFEKSIHMELMDKMDKVGESYQNMERYILRNYSPKEQMDYLSEMYSHSTKENIEFLEKEKSLNDFFDMGHFANYDVSNYNGSIVSGTLLNKMYEGVRCERFLNDPYYQNKINQPVLEGKEYVYNPDFSTTTTTNISTSSLSLDSYFQVNDFSNIVPRKEMTMEEFIKARESEIPK